MKEKDLHIITLCVYVLLCFWNVGCSKLLKQWPLALFMFRFIGFKISIFCRVLACDLTYINLLYRLI